MAARSRKIAVFIAPETGGYAVDPDADGSGGLYKPVKILGNVGFPADNLEKIDTNYQRGVNRITRQEIGADGAALELEMPLQGFDVAAGDGGSVPATDAQDLIFAAAFGAATANTGEGVDTTSGAATLAVETGDPLAAQDLAPVQGASTNSARTQWRHVTGSATPWTIDRNWDDVPGGSEVLYGTRQWSPNDTGGGDSLACYVQIDGTAYTLLGGRPTALKITMAAGQIARLAVSIQFDSKTRGAKGTEPTIASSTIAGLPIKGMLSGFIWNDLTATGGSDFTARQVELDFGLAADVRSSIAGAQGRANIEVISANPTITVDPIHADLWEDEFRADPPTPREVMISFGAGTLAGGRVNTCAFYAAAAEITAAGDADDNGRIRKQITARVVDAGELSSGVDYNYWRFARA